MEFRNWSGVHVCNPTAICEPRDEAEVAELIAGAAARGERVKVVGAGHSWSDAMCTDGLLLRLDRMQRVLEIDHDAKRVTVEAGIRLHQLNRELWAQGLALPVLGSVAEQSVAGAISTGTHGSGVDYGSIASAVVALRLITANGEALDVDGGELLSAARVSLGALGVITRVTLQCEPAFYLHERIEILDFDDALARMDSLACARQHVKLWWLPHTRSVRVSSLQRTDERPQGAGPLRQKIEVVASRVAGRAVDLPSELDLLLNRSLFPRALALSARLPSVTPVINHAVAASFRPAERVGRSYEVFGLTMPPVHREMEYGIRRADAAEALEATRALIETERLKVDFINEVRFVAADDIMLSGAYGRDSCQLGAYIGDTSSRARYFAAFETLCLGLGGRPHWGKEFAATPAQLAAAFPRFEVFAALRQELDPEGLFDNAFLRRVFGTVGVGEPS